MRATSEEFRYPKSRYQFIDIYERAIEGIKRLVSYAIGSNHPNYTKIIADAEEAIQNFDGNDCDAWTYDLTTANQCHPEKYFFAAPFDHNILYVAFESRHALYSCKLYIGTPIDIARGMDIIVEAKTKGYGIDECLFHMYKWHPIYFIDRNAIAVPSGILNDKMEEIACQISSQGCNLYRIACDYYAHTRKIPAYMYFLASLTKELKVGEYFVFDFEDFKILRDEHTDLLGNKDRYRFHTLFFVERYNPQSYKTFEYKFGVCKGDDLPIVLNHLDRNM